MAKMTISSFKVEDMVGSRENCCRVEGWCWWGKSAHSLIMLTRLSCTLLDENYYRKCVEIFHNLPDYAKLAVNSEEDWISLFALGINGYTQRHTDIRDIQGGLAGLFTVGRYTGKFRRK